MTTTQKHDPSMNEARYSDLKRMLEERRKEIMSEVQGRIRDQREADAWGRYTRSWTLAKVPKRTFRKISSLR